MSTDAQTHGATGSKCVSSVGTNSTRLNATCVTVTIVQRKTGKANTRHTLERGFKVYGSKNRTDYFPALAMAIATIYAIAQLII